MSFRSRSRSIQAAPRLRSLSSSRIPTTTSSSNYYSNNSSSFANTRPLSSGYSTGSSYTPSNYISQYSSRDNLYSSPSSHYSSYYNGSTNGRRDSYGGATHKNPYASDRYISPYTSSYDNGITTASLCLSSYGNKSPSNYTKSPSSSYKSDYLSRPSSLAQSRLSGSNSSLSTFATTTSKNIGTSTSVQAGLNRSQSVRDPERKSRTARRSASMKSTRSLSISSEKSEGYEVSNRNRTWFCVGSNCSCVPIYHSHNY